MTPARLLVVDDSRSTRAALTAFLAKHGHDVVALESGEAALARLEDERFDLVLLDVVMKGMDGLHVLAEIRKRFSKLELPVLMATARTDSLDVVRALELGANDYVTKPLDLPIAGARIESLLALRGEVAQIKNQTPLLGADGSIATGTVLDGRYELIEVVGKGGFAVVYEARQVSTGQTVAVKLMKAHRAVSGDVELARFRREMSLIAELRHPHIVRLIDSGWLELGDTLVSVTHAPADDDGTRGATEGTGGTGATVSLRPGQEADSSSSGVKSIDHPVREAHVTEVTRIPFIVMEFLRGESLRAMLSREGRLTVAHTVDLLLPIVSAMHEAHSRGAVHRDIKPANIFLAEAHDGSSRPLVLDFGIAKLVGASADEQLTLATGEGIMGTPGWWAPEQAQPNGVIDERTDEFQLGAVIYRCVTGVKPFNSTGPKLLYQVADGQFPLPSRHVDDLPSGFETVLLKIMATEPADRFPTMRSVARALLPFATKRAHAVWEPVFEPGDTVPPPG